MNRAPRNSPIGPLLVVLALLLPATVGADSANPGIPEPEPRHAHSAQLIRYVLDDSHLREGRDFDDELSRQTFKAYFNALDPERYYFLQSDIERFAEYRTRLDDYLRRGNVDPAYEIFDLYLERVQQRSEYALQLLEQDLSFDGKETIELDRSDAEWAASKEELDRLWRRRVTNDALTRKLAGDDMAEIKETLTKRYERMARNARQYSAEDIFQVYMNAWSHGFDPHTAYMSPRTSENFDINMKLSLEGIGALLRSESDYTEIVELIPGGPASKSGELSPGDRIIGVAQGQEEMVDVVGWRLPDVVDLIRGPADSVVRLEILPAEGGSSTAPEVVKLTRSKVELEEQAAQSEVIEVQREDATYRVGVIEIPAFYIDFQAAQAGKEDYRSTTRDVRRLIDELQSGKGVDGLVVDLRSNAGGSLEEAAKLTGLFIEDGPVVQIKSNRQIQTLRDDDGETLAYAGPLAVLVNSYSASASEIFAGAIQDYGRGIVVGSQTFGKGTVQQLVDLSRWSDPDQKVGRMKVTMAKFYRITGASTQQKGVTPDISLPSPTRNEEVGETAHRNALPWDKIAAVEFDPTGRMADILPLLTERYQARSKDNEALQALSDEYALLRERRNETTVSLNEAMRRAEQKQAEQRRLELINRRLEALGREPVESVEAVESMEELPDVLLQSTAEIVADMQALKQPPDKSTEARIGANMPE